MVLIEQAADLRVDDETIGEIAALETQFEIFRFMKRLTEKFGSRAFMILHLPLVTSSELQPNSILTSWPAELLAAYDQEMLTSNSPVFERLRNSALPFFYDISMSPIERSDGKTESVRAMFMRFNMPRALHIPVHDAASSRGVVSFAGDRAPFTPSETRDLTFAAIHVFDRLSTIRRNDTRLAEPLTDREIDCLNWTAAGKTSAEIANILNLSEHTVNHYLNRATKKLDTVNRTQAVAKALRTGIIV